MNLDAEIITVRPDVAIDTLQKLPNYVGISSQTAGAKGISMNIVIIPAGAKAQPHYHDGFETAIYIPSGLPHQPVNLSQDSEAIALVSRTDASEQESVRAYQP
jgi:uncharacterized RmlC-like cupin family protein